MADKKDDLHQNIHDALNLNGDPTSIAAYYKRWAETYDTDVIDNYYGVEFIVELLHKHVQNRMNVHGNQEETAVGALEVLDVGCGTGLLAKPLHKLGYKNLHGLDLSEDMLQKARQTGLYKSLYGSININEPVPTEYLGAFGASICLGVFTPGHVQAAALHQILNMTASGGIAVISTRVPYYDSTDFQRQNDLAITNDHIQLVEQVMNAPYRDDGDAHYWVYSVNR